MIAAVVLAAGGSVRLGQPKQLLTLAGQPLVRRAARAALDAGCDPVAVVVGSCPGEIATALQAMAVVIVPNDHWERGIGSSIRAGIDALPDCDGVIILACDQPAVDGELIRRLFELRAETAQPIIASAYSATLGVPALFDHQYFAALRALPDEEGAKAIITEHPDEVASLPFPEGGCDIDTREDLAFLAPGRSFAK